MRNLLLCFLFGAFVSPVFSQIPPENLIEGSQQSTSQLTIERTGGENMFYMNGQKIVHNDVKNLMAVNDAALREFRRARTNYGFAIAFASTGGALIGWPIGTALGGGDPEWAMLGAGAALVGVSFIFQSGYNKRSQKALDILNGTSSHAASDKGVVLSIVPTGNGLGLRLMF